MTMSAPAKAQYVDGPTWFLPSRPARADYANSRFLRDRQQAVGERMLQEFRPTGLLLGGLVAYPGLMAKTEFISNPLANDQRRRPAVALILYPNLALRNRFGRVDVEAYAQGTVTRISGVSTENTEQAVGGMRVETEIAMLTSIFAAASYGARITPRYASDSPIDARKPLRYRETAANLGVRREQGSFRLTARGDLQTLRYSDGERLGGGPLVARDRDRSVLRALARLDYAVQPSVSVYLAASGNRMDYRLPPSLVPIRRDSRGWGTFVGTSLDLVALFRLDLRLGYIRQTFAAGVRPVSGLGFNGKLEYSPTRLTTVTLSGEREVRDGGVPGTGGYLHTGGEARVDHELRRYLVAGLLAGRAHDTFRGGGDRRELNTYAGLSGTYLSKRGRSFKLGYQYSERRCECSTVGASFMDHRLFAALTLRY